MTTINKLKEAYEKDEIICLKSAFYREPQTYQIIKANFESGFILLSMITNNFYRDGYEVWKIDKISTCDLKQLTSDQIKEILEHRNQPLDFKRTDSINLMDWRTILTNFKSHSPFCIGCETPNAVFYCGFYHHCDEYALYTNDLGPDAVIDDLDLDIYLYDKIDVVTFGAGYEKGLASIAKRLSEIEKNKDE